MPPVLVLTVSRRPLTPLVTVVTGPVSAGSLVGNAGSWLPVEVPPRVVEVPVDGAVGSAGFGVAWATWPALSARALFWLFSSAAAAFSAGRVSRLSSAGADDTLVRSPAPSGPQLHSTRACWSSPASSAVAEAKPGCAVGGAW